MEKNPSIIKVDSSIERFMPDFTGIPKVTKHQGRRSPWGQEGACPPTFWLLMFFMINDSKTKLKKC